MKYLLRILIVMLSGFMLVVSSQASEKTGPKPEAPPWNLEQLMTDLSKIGNGSATFKEERHISFLVEPLISKGNLRFKSPDYLFKHTETPKDERMVIAGDEMTVTSLEDGFQRTISLNDYPQLRGLLDGIRFALSGNLQALRDHYELSLEGKRDDWKIQLIPRAQTILEIIEKIFISGAKDRILKVETRETNGDFMVMTIEPLEP